MILVLAVAEKNTNNAMEKKRKYFLSFKKIAFILMGMLFYYCGAAQNLVEIDSSINDQDVLIFKDSRIDVLGEKMKDYNANLSNKTKIVNGYRLMVISTTDRAKAMKVRTAVLQKYPNQKLYMIFQAPNIKLKMGNFADREEAKKVRAELIAAKIVSGNIFIVPEPIELKPVKNKNPKSVD